MMSGRGEGLQGKGEELQNKRLDSKVNHNSPDYSRKMCKEVERNRNPENNLLNEIKKITDNLIEYNNKVGEFLTKLNDDKATESIKGNINNIVTNIAITECIIEAYIREEKYNKWKNEAGKIIELICGINDLIKSKERNLGKLTINVNKKLEELNVHLLRAEGFNDISLKKSLKDGSSASRPQERQNNGEFGGKQHEGQEKVQPLGATTSKSQEHDLSRKKQSESQKELQRRGELQRKLEQLKEDFLLPKRQHGVQKESGWYYQYAYCQKSQSQESQLKWPIDVQKRLGKYKLIRMLGKGGFGKVFLGKHVDTGEEVAIKMLHGEINQEGVNNFCREIWDMVNLEHQNIVPLLGFGRQGKVPYFVMEYMPGKTLEGKRLSRTEVIEKMEEICQGVKHIHEKGFIHQDLKPENILLGENGEAVIGDLGLAAKVDTEGTKEGWGTCLFKAYEQWKNQGKRNAGACYQSDVYALALIAFELATGKRLLKSMRNDGKIKQLLEDKKKKWKNKYQRKDDRMLERYWVENKQYRWLHKRTGEWLRARTQDKFLLALVPALEGDPTKRIQNAMGLYKALKEGLRLQRQEELIKGTGVENVKEIYMDIEGRKERMQLYKMIKPEQQKELVRGLGSEDVRTLYQDLEKQGERIQLYEMLGLEQQRDLKSKEIAQNSKKIKKCLDTLEENIDSHKGHIKEMKDNITRIYAQICYVYKMLEKDVPEEKKNNNWENKLIELKSKAESLNTLIINNIYMKINNYNNGNEDIGSLEKLLEQTNKKLSEEYQVFVNQIDKLRRAGILERTNSKGRSDGVSSSSRITKGLINEVPQENMPRYGEKSMNARSRNFTGSSLGKGASSSDEVLQRAKSQQSIGDSSSLLNKQLTGSDNEELPGYPPLQGDAHSLRQQKQQNVEGHQEISPEVEAETPFSASTSGLQNDGGFGGELLAELKGSGRQNRPRERQGLMLPLPTIPENHPDEDLYPSPPKRSRRKFNLPLPQCFLRRGEDGSRRERRRFRVSCWSSCFRRPRTEE
jgi:serine/threonine protein kinase